MQEVLVNGFAFPAGALFRLELPHRQETSGSAIPYTAVGEIACMRLTQLALGENTPRGRIRQVMSPMSEYIDYARRLIE